MSCSKEEKFLGRSSSSEKRIDCPICKSSCFMGEVRCLPCDKLHLFCTDCLIAFKNVHNLLPGDTYACPICRKSFHWPINGVRNFQLYKESENVITENEPELELFDVKKDELSLRVANERDSNNVDKTIEEVERNLAISPGKSFDSLQREFNEFFAELDKKLNVILDNAIELLIKDGKIDRRSLDDENIEEYKYSTEMDDTTYYDMTCNHKYEKSFCPFTELPFRQINFDFDEEIKVVSSSKRAFYILSVSKVLEKNDEYIYNIYEIDMRKSTRKLIHSLTCAKDTIINMSVRLKAFMEIYLIETEKKSSSVLSSVTLTGQKYKLETILDRSENGWTNVFCLDDSTILFNSKKLAKYVGHFNKKWCLPFPEDSVIDDVNCINQTIYFLLTDNKILSINLENKSFQYLKISLEKGEFKINEELINGLKNGNCLLSNSNYSFLVNYENNQALMKPLPHQSVESRIIYYHFTQFEFIVCYVNKKNVFVTQFFKL